MERTTDMIGNIGNGIVLLTMGLVGALYFGGNLNNIYMATHSQTRDVRGDPNKPEEFVTVNGRRYYAVVDGNSIEADANNVGRKR
ncbi:MAG: hypothetical protein Q8N88_05330 [Nanoarchaeota archaeon]|nr:hypothetical protein [Nanoarchaeota archaeon]